VYGIGYFAKDFSFNVHFYSALELTEALKAGKSLIRFGDGEINLMLDLRNHYHSFDPTLKKMMNCIVSNYSEQSSYILSVPKFINMSNEELKRINRFNVWLPLKTMFLLRFPKNIAYMDAHNFYYDNYFETVIAPIFKEKKVVFITNKDTIQKQVHNQHFLWPNAIMVEAPASDAIKQYDDLTFKIDSVLKQLDSKETVLFFAFGPVGNYIQYIYAQKGYQSIDVGRAAEIMFTDDSIEHVI